MCEFCCDDEKQRVEVKGVGAEDYISLDGNNILDAMVDDWNVTSVGSFEIKHCPMCGRNL